MGAAELLCNANGYEILVFPVPNDCVVNIKPKHSQLILSISGNSLRVCSGVPRIWDYHIMTGCSKVHFPWEATDSLNQSFYPCFKWNLFLFPIFDWCLASLVCVLLYYQKKIGLLSSEQYTSCGLKGIKDYSSRMTTKNPGNVSETSVEAS